MKKSSTIISNILVAAFLACSPVFAAVSYVTPAGAGAKDGSSWANARSGESIQVSINELSDAGGGEVWVAAGTYYPTQDVDGNVPSDDRNKTFLLKSGVAVYGGFAGTEAQLSQREKKDCDNDGIIRGWEWKNETILSGDIDKNGLLTNNAYTVVTGKEISKINALIDGFTITGGNNFSASPGGGILMRSTTMTRCQILKNNSRQYSGGVHLSVFSLADSCLIAQNNASDFGGGITVEENAILKNSWIINNTSLWITGEQTANYGGGMFLHGGGKVYSCFIANNYSAYMAGGVYVESGIVINSIMVNNTARRDGGGVYLGNGTLLNCSIGQNSSVMHEGDGLYFSNNDGHLINTIVADSIKNAESYYNEALFPHVKSDYSLFINRTPGLELIDSVVYIKGNVIFIKPTKFEGKATNASDSLAVFRANWSLAPSSIAINSGTPDIKSLNMPTIDFNNKPRVVYDRIDVGAMEFAQRVYVSPDGSGNFSGSDWQNTIPGKRLSDMYAGEYWFKTGVYIADVDKVLMFSLNRNSTVYGGFRGDETIVTDRPKSDNNHDGIVDAWEFTYPSDLKGTYNVDNSIFDDDSRVFPVVQMDAENALLDGFTISNAFQAVYANGGLVRNCEIKDNTILNSSYQEILFFNYLAQIEACYIHNNIALKGGVVHLNYMNKMRTSIIANNMGNAGGGVTLMNKSSIDRCTIINNVNFESSTSLSRGGGVCMYDKGTSISNCLIANNTNKGIVCQGGGVWAEKGTISNTTIVNNNIIAEYALGDDLAIGNAVTMRNTIVGSPLYYSDITITNDISHSAIVGGFADFGAGDSIYLVATREELMKQFVAPTSFAGAARSADSVKKILAADWHLSTNKFLNKGLYVSNPDTLLRDLDNKARVQHDTIDLGAYEIRIPLPKRGTQLQILQAEKNTVRLNWKRTSATMYSVFIQEGTNASRLAAIDGKRFIADTVLGKKNAYGTWYCMYSGSDTSVTLHSLLKGQLYKAFVITSNGTRYQVYNDSLVDDSNLISFTTKRDQTISFNVPQAAVAGSSFLADVSATSGLDVVLSSPDSKYVSINGTRLTILKADDTPRTISITASQAGGTLYEPAAPVTKTIIINKATQTISFPSIADKVVGNEDFVPLAKSSSGYGITYTLDNDMVVEFVGSSLRIIGDGTVKLTASQEGDSIFSAAADVSQTFSVTKSPQTISFPAIADKVFGNEDFVPLAKASSGIGVTYKLSNDAVVQFVGSSLRIIGIGTVTLTASQEGDDAFSAATDVSQTFTVRKATQTISFVPIPNKTYGDVPFAPVATSSAHLKITLLSNDPSVAKIVDDRIVIVGTGAVTITASQEGTAYCAAAKDSSVSFTVRRAPQEITMNVPANLVYGDKTSIELDKNLASGLAVTYSSSNLAVATVTGNIITITGVGSTAIKAVQAGNDFYEPASAQQQVLTVSKMPQAFEGEMALPDTIVYSDTLMSVHVVSGKGLPVDLYSLNESVAVVADGKIRVVGAGTTIISARQQGNDTIAAAKTIDHRLVVLPRIQSIAVNANAEVEYGSEPFEINAQSSVNTEIGMQSLTPNIVQMVNGKVQIVGVGTARIRITQEAAAGYKAVDTTISIIVTKAKDSVSFAALENKLLGQKDFTLYAESKSGTAVKFYSTNSAVASIVEDVVTINGAGVCQIRAVVKDSKNFTGVMASQQFIVSSLNVLRLPSFATSRDTIIDLNGLRLNKDSIVYSFVSAKHNSVAIDGSKAIIKPNHSPDCWEGVDTLWFKATNQAIIGDSLTFAVKLAYTRHADQLGMVTTDSLTGTYNIVAWEPQYGANTAQWIVCRRSQSLSQWENIDTVPATDSTYSVDRKVNTRQQAYQYALKTVDSSGCVSNPSARHTTMHLKTGVSLQGLPQLWWSAYEGVDVDAYIIYRKNQQTQQFDSIGSTFLTSFTDQYPNGSASYRVAIRFAHKIVTSRLKNDSGPFSQSMSNLSEAIILTSVGANGESISLSPNPVADVTTLSLPSMLCQITITDINGRQVLPTIEATGEAVIDASSLSQGVYNVTVIAGDEVNMVPMIKTDGAK